MIILTDDQESLSVPVQTPNPSYSLLFSQVEYSFEKPGPLYIFIAPFCNAAKKSCFLRKSNFVKLYLGVAWGMKKFYNRD